MFEKFKLALIKRIEKLIYLCSPVGAVVPVLATVVPEGLLLINGQNVYEAEHKRLYDVLVVNANLTKGSDANGNYVKLPDADGRSIELTTNASFVGRLLAAALPNITGAIKDVHVGNIPRGGGCVQWIDNGELEPRGLVGAWSFGDFLIDLSKDNATYNGTTVQPRALQLLACIRA